MRSSPARDHSRPARRLPRRLRADDAPRRRRRPLLLWAPYFDRVLEADRTWLALATAPGGELAAASIAAVSDGYLHYYLSGSADSHLRDSPMKNVVARLVELRPSWPCRSTSAAASPPATRLEEIKRGFANRQEPWHTSEIICNQDEIPTAKRGSRRRRPSFLLTELRACPDRDEASCTFSSLWLSDGHRRLSKKLSGIPIGTGPQRLFVGIEGVGPVNVKARPARRRTGPRSLCRRRGSRRA